jgi:chromosome segregation ATPase
VVKGTTPEKEDINVLVIDSEGLGALDEDSNHDVRIFSLAILLSSYFIYNSMGSIDENALQSLSLVIQLTKHIQIKASGIASDTDPEEYSRYFPNFMWVVRDFSLQLVDNEGESITPKDYLERALHEQKGFSEAAEQKNRIRRLLRCFFKERDCSCVVRPSTNEEDLQSLESRPFENLREEFKLQITQLRKKVMKRVKPKTIMNGQTLSGTMFADLVLNYVEAINKGAVPNIENAWSYISKGECQKSMEKAFESFVEEFTSSFQMNAPVYDLELKDMFKEAKVAALSIYDQNSVGDVAEQYKDDLKTRMKQKFSQIKAENEKMTKKEAQVYLQNYFAPIEDKLRNNEYNNFNEYEKEIKEVEQVFMERGPPGPNREAVCQNYVINALTDGADYFMRTLKSELHLQTSLTKESTQKMESRIQELKSDLTNSKEEAESKIRQSDNDKAQLIAKEQSMREALSEVKREKENAEKEWKERYQTEKLDAGRLVEEYKSRMQASEETQKESQRRTMSSESEFEKQKALYDQKIQFFESTIETLKQKDKENQTEIKNQKKELMSNMKENNSKYEDKINALNKNLDEAQDDVAEKDNKIAELEQKIYVSNSSLNEKELELQNLRENSSEFERLKEENETLKSEMEEKNKVFNEDLQEERDQLKYQLDELRLQISQKDSELQSEKAKWEKEYTIQSQKIEFLTTQVSEGKSQLDDNRKNHEAMLKAVQSRESEKGEAIEEADKKIDNLKQSHFKEMKELEERFDINNKKLSDELERCRHSENDFKMKFKLLSTDNQKDVNDLRESLEQAEVERDRAIAEVKQLEHQKQSLVQQTEERYKSTIQQLESELEQKDSKNQSEIQDQQQRSEDDLAQLKSYYELEKERLEKRIQDEKHKSAKQSQSIQEEYEQRIQDDQNQHEDDLEMLQEELRDKEDQLQAMTTHYEHELSLYDQKYQSLEEHLKETKKALDDVQEKNSTSFDQQMQSFNKERKELNIKNDTLNQSLTEKEKRITALENQNESLISQIKNKDDDIEVLRGDVGTKKKGLEEEIEKLRNENSTVSDEYMQFKLKIGREEALHNQKFEFQDNKIKELLSALSDSSSSYQEKLDSQKNELGQEVNAKVDMISQEKEKIRAKFDEKKKALKELEKETSVKISKLERDRAVNLERIENLEKKLSSEQEYSKKQIESMREKIASQQTEGTSAVDIAEQKYEDLKFKYEELQKAKVDIQSRYEKEEALWKGKAEFLEDQKAQLKKDLADSNKKLEASISQLQSKGGRGDQDKKQLDIINHMEKEYKDQINSIQISHEKYVTELSEKNRDLESKYHILQEKYELAYRDSSSSSRNLEKRVNDLESKEKSNIEEIRELKEQRDRMLTDNKSMIDQEKEPLKQKIHDLEARCKAAESHKGSFTFELEKERMKWSTEKDSLERIKEEMQETIAKLQRKNERVMLENEKLKEKNKNAKKYSRYGGVGNSSIMDPNSVSARFATGKYLNVNKEIEQDEHSNKSGKEGRFKTFTKFIGDGKEGDKHSEKSDNVEKTPDRFAKESESTNTLSPQDDKE